MGKQDKLHMIGHGHIDPVWLWVWQEGYHEVHATFQSALERTVSSVNTRMTAKRIQARAAP